MATAASLITVLSDSTFADQVLDVAAFLSRSRPEAERTEYIESWSQRAAGEEGTSSGASRNAIIEGLVGQFKGLGEGQDREIEGVHNLVAALLLSVEDSSRVDSLVEKHVQLVAAETGRDAIKYRILSNVYNSLPATSRLRETTFLALVEVAAANDDLDLVSPALSSLPHWLAQWNISEQRKAAVLDTVANKLEASHAAERAYEFRVAHLQYLSSNSAASPDAETAKTSAEKAVASALKLPKVFDFDSLLRLSVVQGLQQSSPAVLELVKILVQGSLSDYNSWASSGSAELNRLGVEATIVERKVRLLELAALCSKAVEGATTQGAGAEVSYQAISQAIQVNDSEVESWVIDVIRAGLVSGKLSQVRSSFRVYRSTYRTFKQEQWKLLETRLQEWDSTLEGILSTLSAPRGPGRQEQATSGSNAPAIVGVPGVDAALSQA